MTTSYAYNAEGIRVRKTHSDGRYDIFHVLGGTIVGETRYGADGKVDLWLRYNMDAGGSICGISLWYPGDGAWTDYYFVKNLQGDVLEVRKCADNSIAASYSYDAWGNILTKSGTLANVNPFRYRCYYFDNETWFYYLQSRYYDPATGRFINADTYPSTGQALTGNNMFAYCGNNPVCRQDSFGTFWETVLGAALGGGIAGALIGAVSHVVSCGLSGDEVTAAGLLSATLIGAASGAIGAVAGVVEGAAAVGSVLVGAISGISTAVNTDGSIDNKIAAGLTAGVAAGFGTYLGTKLPVAKSDGFSAGFTAFAGGLMMGTQAEIVNVVAQQGISAAYSSHKSANFPTGGAQNNTRAIMIY